MRKILCVVLCLVLASGCQMKPISSSYIAKPSNEEEIVNKTEINTEIGFENDTMRAIWLSYIDLNFSGKTEAEFKSGIDTMFENVVELGLNTVICHVRANADAAYKSEYFPLSLCYYGQDGNPPSYDPLAYMVKAAHERGLKIHAWFNPYRVAGKINKAADLPNNIAKKWLTDNIKNNDYNVLPWGEGMYFNPAKEEVKDLIVNGVVEVVENYDIDGVQFDDYFYPTSDEEFDKASYDGYCKTTDNPLPLDDWRRRNVNVMVKSVYNAIKKVKDIPFGISPAAAISSDKSDRNYTQIYADIYTWVENENYIDYIAPQLYFGYNYKVESFRFKNLLKNWYNLTKDRNVELYVGLAPYKIDTEDAESHEWQKDKKIIARQIEDAQKIGADGFMLYSYNYVFSSSTKHTAERNAMKEVLERLYG